MKTIKTGSDFSGVGAFDYAMKRVCNHNKFIHKRVYACDWDKYARITYEHNHGTPKYFPQNVYDRTIPEESLDIYMTSPPCQSFSIAGSRKGKDSENGVLFFNSHEFIKKNKPRFFIFENVKGLLSDDSGRTFQEWLNYLGGKSLNGLPLLFKDDNAVDYHVYYKVLNSKKHGVPQNRERIFIVGIRDDADNDFRFPKEEHLTLKLKDVLEAEVDEKYFLSDNAINRLCHNESGFGSVPKSEEDIASTVCASDYKIARGMNVLKVKSATKKGFETATENDSINFSVPNSETRRGRVGKEVAQTLDTQCNQGIWSADYRYDEGLRIRKGDASLCVTTGKTIYTNEPQIRRLTPGECFRLQDFPDSFDFSVVSDSQAYKQAGNSITVRVLELILNKLKL